MGKVIKNTVKEIGNLYSEVISELGNDGPDGNSLKTPQHDWIWIAGSVIMAFGAIAFFR